MTRLALAFVLVAAACGGGSKKPDTMTTGDGSGAVTAPAGVQLELGELKLIDVNKNKAVLVHADGVIELEGQKLAKVTTDGKIAKLDTGEVGFTLNADGTINGPDGKALEVTLSADGVITSGDKTISLDDAGMLIGGNPNAPQMKVEGATTVGLKRTAMLVMIVITAGDGGEPPPPTRAP